MPYCFKCGKEIIEGSVYCTHCGIAQAPQKPPSAQPIQPLQIEEPVPAPQNAYTAYEPQTFKPRPMRLHCPRCKSYSFSPSVEAAETFGSATRVTQNIAVGSASTIHKSYWICHDCGLKFRNVDDLDAENERICQRERVFIAIFVVLYLILLVSIIRQGSWDQAIISMVIFVVAMVVILIVAKRSRTAREFEADSLRIACFD